MKKQLRAAVVGLAMGREHALNCAALSEDFALAALCDLSADILERVGGETGCQALYQDYRRMLREVKPDVVFIATPDRLHEEMTLQAAETGVRGIYCEKPIAVSMASALRMQRACEERGIVLIIGHMRRFSPYYREMRRVIQEGTVGRITLVKGFCAGDLLVDGTHLLDGIQFLLGDLRAEWVLGQIYRGRKATPEELAQNPFLYCGTRYGHAVEEGAIALISMEGGAQVELQVGTTVPDGRGYQDIEVYGSKGRLRRAGDGAAVKLLLDGETGWRELEVDEAGDRHGYVGAATAFAQAVRQGGEHPMSIAHAIRNFGILMGIYESARLHSRLEFPLTQQAFPLELMLEDGELQ